MIYSTYDQTTGQILFTVTNSEDTIPENTLAGAYNDNEHYYDITSQTVISKPKKPSNNHIWDITNKIWKLDTNKLAKSIRRQRNLLLESVDRVNPVWYASLSSEQQSELQTYRIALLNVPQQAGFPDTIEWPSKPTWL